MKVDVKSVEYREHLISAERVRYTAKQETRTSKAPSLSVEFDIEFPLHVNILLDHGVECVALTPWCELTSHMHTNIWRNSLT